MIHALNAEDITTLKLFNEKATKLSTKAFLNSKKISTHTKWEMKEGFTENSLKGPTDEEIESFALTMRFFCQDNEPCSFRNLSKIYSKLKSTRDYTKKFNNARLKLNNFLDSTPEVNYIINGETVTNRKIFETFMFGELSHSTKKEDHDFWGRIPPMYIRLKSEFIIILNFFYGAINYVKELNEDVLR